MRLPHIHARRAVPPNGGPEGQRILRLAARGRQLWRCLCGNEVVR